MKIYTLKRTQWILGSLEQVFAFFQRPENLERITPARVGFQILTPKPIKMEKGALIDYTISPLGFPMRWTTMITDYEPPHRFVDQQLQGPYAYWHHTHRFEVKDAGVEMTDTVLYALKPWLLGDLAHVLFVRRQLNHIFDYRAQVIEKYLAH